MLRWCASTGVNDEADNKGLWLVRGSLWYRGRDAARDDSTERFVHPDLIVFQNTRDQRSTIDGKFDSLVKTRFEEVPAI